VLYDIRMWARTYTYVTMALSAEAVTHTAIFIVLDRPNPIAATR
jgi:uncharacterized protein YbbC (DUF1343 family)